ncbi:hypothetical protein E1295_09475 [Nonomuraea mesophila]|uniref:FAD-binding domain-containing protein n=1 Tax=Nonomuraea mesophila TaxID=2530382 RepID=A0A4R5FUS6_9ACTN|nr:hypothetical protein E1295_09475 [Nonomuraea mesophila]
MNDRPAGASRSRGSPATGTAAQTLLAWRGVPVTLVERHPGTSIRPKEFGVGPRAIEPLRVVGVAQLQQGVALAGDRGGPERLAVHRGYHPLDRLSVRQPAPAGRSAERGLARAGHAACCAGPGDGRRLPAAEAEDESGEAPAPHDLVGDQAQRERHGHDHHVRQGPGVGVP